MRKLYWAWPDHIKEGRMVLLESREPSHAERSDKVRVRLEIVKPRKRKKRKSP